MSRLILINGECLGDNRVYVHLISNERIALFFVFWMVIKCFTWRI